MAKKLKKLKRLTAIFAAASAATMVPTAAQAQDHSLVVDQSTPVVEITTLAGQKRMSGMIVEERSCLSLNDFLQSTGDYRRAPSYDTLRHLYNSSAFSRQLMQDAAAQDVKVCDMRLDDTLAGVHIPSQNKIGIDFSRRDSVSRNMVYIAHEFAHYTQFLNGSEYFEANRSIYDNQRVILAMETAAPVAELIALYYADKNGEASLRDAYPSRSAQYKWYRHFKKDVKRQMRAGYSEDAAINIAAAKVWKEVFEDQHKLDHYNNALIAFTLLNIHKIEPHIAANYEDPNLNASIRGAGKLSDTLDFANPNAMPSGDELVGKNKRMRQVLEAVEWYRQSRIYGAANSYVMAERNRLRAAGNEYVDADFAEAARKIRRGTTPERAVAGSVRDMPSYMAGNENIDRNYIMPNVSVTYRTPN